MSELPKYKLPNTELVIQCVDEICAKRVKERDLSPQMEDPVFTRMAVVLQMARQAQDAALGAFLHYAPNFWDLHRQDQILGDMFQEWGAIVRDERGDTRLEVSLLHLGQVMDALPVSPAARP